MSKELVISANRHETRVAVLEEDQVTEIYYQRENEYSLAGSIHKGRVTRVLPGMQSAFVDIGLERDAFLYVSDFFEDNDEYDKIVTSVEEKVFKQINPNPASLSAAPAVSAPAIETAPAAAPVEGEETPAAAVDGPIPTLAPQAGGMPAGFGALFGVGMAVMAPIIYGVMGFVMGASVRSFTTSSPDGWEGSRWSSSRSRAQRSH